MNTTGRTPDEERAHQRHLTFKRLMWWRRFQQLWVLVACEAAFAEEDDDA